VARSDGEAVAVVRLLWTDRRFWGGRDEGDAAYVHSLAVRRDLAGRGIGAAVLAWAEREAAARGRRFLRLDCLAANAGLTAYYERAGFSPIGIVRLGGEAMLLLEKPLPG
jgi:GNAT superfamily N-acetyltransferase